VIGLLAQGNARVAHALERVLRFGDGGIPPVGVDARQRDSTRCAAQQGEQLRQLGPCRGRQLPEHVVEAQQVRRERCLSRRVVSRQTAVKHGTRDGREKSPATMQ